MPGIMPTSDIEEKDGKIYAVNRQEVTKADLMGKLAQIVKQIEQLEEHRVLLDTKIKGLK